MWHALSIGLAVVTAAIVNQYVDIDHSGWLVLTAFLCCQTARGTPLRQGLIVCFTIIFAFLLACFLVSIQLMLLTYVIVATVFVISAYLVCFLRPLSNQETFQLLLFALVLAIATFFPSINQVSMSDRLLSIALGAVIGIGFNQLFFSIRLDKFFFRGVMPLLKSLRQYSVTLANNLAGTEEIMLLAEQKLQVQKSMLFQYSMYPSWVYETGFNPGLRSGWRYFLIHLERATEIYFSLDFLARRRIDLTLLSEFISTTMHKNAELLDILIQYTEYQRNRTVTSDFTSDLTALEEALRHVVPNQIELLDISPDYISLVALVKDLRDLRGVLLQLVMSLPTVKH